VKTASCAAALEREEARFYQAPKIGGQCEDTRIASACWISGVTNTVFKEPDLGLCPGSDDSLQAKPGFLQSAFPSAFPAVG